MSANGSSSAGPLLGFGTSRSTGACAPAQQEELDTLACHGEHEKQTPKSYEPVKLPKQRRQQCHNDD